MPDISGQLIKDSYSYILQVDTSTGYVYRVNGNVPVNPIFSSGLTVFSAFTFVDGNQQNGYVLTSDGNGNSRWASVSGTSVSSVTASTGLSGNSTTGAITLINTAPDKTVVITGGTNIQIISDYPNFGINFTGTTSSSGDYLPLSGGTVTGNTIFQSGLTANTLTVTGNTLLSGLTAVTISATTYDNLPNTLYTGDGILTGNRVVNLSSYTLNFSSSTTPNTLVMSGGNVGIGTETPSQKLEVSGNSIFNLAPNGYIKLTATNEYSTYFQSSYGNTLIANNAYFDGSSWIQGANGSASMIQMEPTLGQIVFNTAGYGSIGGPPSFVETIRLVSGNTGINVSSPTNKLHVSDSTDPVRLEGVQTSNDAELLTIDGSGVVHKAPLPFLRNETNSGTTDTITINQSIFNPSNLTVLSTSVFIVDTNADYYVLGDFYNSGTTIVNGTLKIGGVLYNYGTITGSGIIE